MEIQSEPQAVIHSACSDTWSDYSRLNKNTSSSSSAEFAQKKERKPAGLALLSETKSSNLRLRDLDCGSTIYQTRWCGVCVSMPQLARFPFSVCMASLRLAQAWLRLNVILKHRQWSEVLVYSLLVSHQGD
jgi:hypothetical protein